MANFTGTRIKDTYQRVIQIEGNEFQDGLGNAVNIPFSQISGSGTLISGSSQLASDISGSITSFSSSISSRVSVNESNVSNLLSFSSSLDSTYATDVELADVSSSLLFRIGVTDGNLNSYTYPLSSSIGAVASANQQSVAALNTATSSYLTGIDAGIVSSSKQISVFGFISSSHTNIAALNLFTSSIQSEVNSLNAATSSFLTGIGAGIVSSSIQISNFGFITSSEGSSTDITALNNFSGSIQTQVDSLNAATSSFAVTTGNIFTGKQELTGSIDVSGSIEIKPTRLEVRTLLTVTPVDTKPTDLTVGTFAVSGSTPIYCDGVNWYPINLGTALPSPVPSPAVTTDSTTVTTDDTTITTDNN